jgi:hypothetical protein
MTLSAMKLTLRKEGRRNEDLQAPTVMTRTIEHSRKRGPFDPRWPPLRSLKEAQQVVDAQPWVIAPAMQAWEGEGGAVRREERWLSRASATVSLPPRSRRRERDRSTLDNGSVAAGTVPRKAKARHKVGHSKH